MDCFTRDQIANMSHDCRVSEEMMFLWWRRFYKNQSFRDISVEFGVGKSAAEYWWNLLTEKLYVRARKFVVNDGPDHATDRIRVNTTNMAKRIHDPQNEGKTILTYIYIEQIQSDHALRQSTWSPHKHSYLVKPHLICTTNGKIVHGGTCSQTFAKCTHYCSHQYHKSSN